jgi:hypothetical protein
MSQTRFRLGSVILLSCTSTNSSTLTQFIEHFQALEESGVEIKAKRICKAPVSCKSSHSNIDNTDTEDDIDSCEAAVSQRTWKDEWVTYLNTNNDVPDTMDVVRWWGVSFILLYLCASLILPFVVAEWYPIPVGMPGSEPEPHQTTPGVQSGSGSRCKILRKFRWGPVRGAPYAMHPCAPGPNRTAPRTLILEPYPSLHTSMKMISFFSALKTILRVYMVLYSWHP